MQTYLCGSQINKLDYLYSCRKYINPISVVNGSFLAVSLFLKKTIRIGIKIQIIIYYYLKVLIYGLFGFI